MMQCTLTLCLIITDFSDAIAEYDTPTKPSRQRRSRHIEPEVESPRTSPTRRRGHQTAPSVDAPSDYIQPDNPHTPLQSPTRARVAFVSAVEHIHEGVIHPSTPRAVVQSQSNQQIQTPDCVLHPVHSSATPVTTTPRAGPHSRARHRSSAVQSNPAGNVKHGKASDVWSFFVEEDGKHCCLFCKYACAHSGDAATLFMSYFI